MKVATFNINNINRRLPNLLRWLRAAKPDVVALQELKATDAEFPQAAIEKAGYGAVWPGQKPWNGVPILARNAEPVLTRTALPGDRDDHEARYIEAAVRGVIVTSIYLPNGNPPLGLTQIQSSPSGGIMVPLVSTPIWKPAACSASTRGPSTCNSGSPPVKTT